MCTVLHNYVSLEWNYFFYLIQSIEDIDSNAKEEMKAEEQVIDNGCVTLLTIMDKSPGTPLVLLCTWRTRIQLQL